MLTEQKEARIGFATHRGLYRLEGLSPVQEMEMEE
jgi:hypothetical protein